VCASILGYCSVDSTIEQHVEILATCCENVESRTHSARKE